MATSSVALLPPVYTSDPRPAPCGIPGTSSVASSRADAPQSMPGLAASNKERPRLARVPTNIGAICFWGSHGAGEVPWRLGGVKPREEAQNRDGGGGQREIKRNQLGSLRPPLGNRPPIDVRWIQGPQATASWWRRQSRGQTQIKPCPLSSQQNSLQRQQRQLSRAVARVFALSLAPSTHNEKDGSVPHAKLTQLSCISALTH